MKRAAFVVVLMALISLAVVSAQKPKYAITSAVDEPRIYATSLTFGSSVWLVIGPYDWRATQENHQPPTWIKLGSTMRDDVRVEVEGVGVTTIGAIRELVKWGIPVAAYVAKPPQTLDDKALGRTVEWKGWPLYGGPYSGVDPGFYGDDPPPTTLVDKVIEIGFRSDGVVVWRKAKKK